MNNIDMNSDNGYENKADSSTQTIEISDVIRVLGDDFSNIYVVSRQSRDIAIYRYENVSVGVKEALNQRQPYKIAIQNYIEANVFPDDREKMMSVMDFDNVCRQLQQAPQFRVHYRVKRDGEVLFYYMKCVRIGDADSFDKIVFAFANEDADVRRNEMESIMRSGTGIGKRKILIVEDDELNRKMLYSLLKDKYQIITAENGEIGLAELETHYRELSLILLDVYMPVCDGFEFLKRVKDDALLSSVPIIVTTVNNSTDTELTCLNLGAADFITKPYNADIVRGRVDNVIRLKESALTLAAVEHDELTGLYTEQAFLHYAKSLIKYKADKNMHLVVAKIKDFKLLNSIYGMKKVDEVLCYLATAYGHYMKDALLARKDNGAFSFLLYTEQNLDHEKMKVISEEIAEHAPVSGLKIKYGIYENIDKELPVTTICDYASMASDTIMDNYECNMAYYTIEMAQKRIYNQMIENRFEYALSHQEFIVYYQPKIDILTEKVIGAEALIRWKMDDGSVISPGDFIPVYETDGLIERLDEYVFRQVCKLQRKRVDEGKCLLPISVNLSRSSILYGGIAERYIQIIEECGIPFGCVPLELTESAAIYSDQIKNTTEKLVNAGFLLHMDDFGSGYSSLVSLNQLPFSTLKIDKSLIDHVCEKNGKTLVEQVIVLSKLLDMKVVAEGVESKAQLDKMKEMKCDAVQGFIYARPMPEEEFVAYVKRTAGESDEK